MSAKKFQNFSLRLFLRFFDIFLKFKKNGGKSPAKITKSTKLRQFLMSILKGLNGFLKNIPEKKYLQFIIIFPFLTFFLVYEHPKGTKHGMKHENKRGFNAKSVEFVAKIQQMLQNNFPTILWYLVYFQNFFLDVLATCS